MSIEGKELNSMSSLSGSIFLKFSTKPFRQIVVDVILFLLHYDICLYCVLFFAPDSSVAMTSTLWVVIVAWRGGLVAGVISSILITFSNLLIFEIPPHNKLELPIHMLFENKISALHVGLIQTMLSAIVIGFISSIVYRLKNEIELRKKTQLELEQKISELDAFGHTVAHDLKNPLGVIKISVERLISDLTNYNDSNIIKKLNFINDGTQHMREIIESILLLAGINRTKDASSTVFHMIQSVEDALSRLKYSIESNEVTIKKPDDWPQVIAYAPWITEVWVNYINNAIIYGGNSAQKIKPVIELGYNKVPNKSADTSSFIKFWVKDNGIGIPADQINSLFKEFTRLQSGQNGHGLGLSIVKSVIFRFSGEVGVESEIGKGSLFYFTLPAPKE